MKSHPRGIVLSLIAATALLCPPCDSPAQGARTPAGWHLDARGPSTHSSRRGTGDDTRDVVERNAPTVLKGAAIVLVGTLLIMTLVLVPFGWMRRIVARTAEKSGRTALPSSRKYLVKLGSLGVPSEYEWRPPNLFIGGNRFSMHLAKRVQGPGYTWELQNGTRIEFVPKAEVEAQRARHLEEFRAQHEAARSWREFGSDEDAGEPQTPPRKS